MIMGAPDWNPGCGSHPLEAFSASRSLNCIAVAGLAVIVAGLAGGSTRLATSWCVRCSCWINIIDGAGIGLQTCLDLEGN
jgi:hypothetical protein